MLIPNLRTHNPLKLVLSEKSNRHIFSRPYRTMTHTQSNRHIYLAKEQASSTNQKWGLIANKMITQLLHCIDTPHPNQHTTLSHCWLLNLPLFHLQLLCPIDGGSLLLLSHGEILCKDNCCTLDLFFRKCIFVLLFCLKPDVNKLIVD